MQEAIKLHGKDAESKLRLWHFQVFVYSEPSAAYASTGRSRRRKKELLSSTSTNYLERSLEHVDCGRMMMMTVRFWSLFGSSWLRSTIEGLCLRPRGVPGGGLFFRVSTLPVFTSPVVTWQYSQAQREQVSEPSFQKSGEKLPRRVRCVGRTAR